MSNLLNLQASAEAIHGSAGIFVNLSVRKPLVIDYKLPYPTGTATGVMINSFFTNGDLAKQQVIFSSSFRDAHGQPVVYRL